MSALARIKKTAAQHEQERQYDKALALYARLLDGAEAGGEEVDVALFNRAGDLALRLGDAPRAVGYFERALDLYAAAGLLNNAVALGVKILRHAPHHLSAHYTLGVLYGRKGFVGDSRQHLLTYAVQMQRAGRVDETGRVLAEVATTCADTAELRAAQDAFSAMGGDPAQAAALAAGPSAAPSAARRSPPASVAAIPAFEFLDATPGAGASASASGAPLTLAPAFEDADVIEPAAQAPAPAPEVELLLPDAPDGDEMAGADLVFLDVPGDGAADDVPPVHGLDRPARPAHLPRSLPDEPPALRIADLADAGRRQPAAPAPALPDWATPPAADLAPTPPVGPAPGRFADLMAAGLGDLGAAAPTAPAADRPAAGAPAFASDDDGLDLGAWLRESTPAESTRMTTAAVPQSGDEQADFDATLRAFTAGVTRSVGHEDFDSHYDLGVAFREMGLLEEAIVEFQRAAQAPGRSLRALEALAQCFLDSDQPELALTTLTGPVAAAEAAGDAGLLGVHYLMGAAAQALNRPDDARRWLVRVVAADVRFRDASSRLAALPPPAPTR
jgi:tetratricopeptide (TPR) repeat protein